MIDVTCAIVKKDSKILVTQRSEKMKLPMKWEFPGGKLNKNESEEECILRELKEELNIKVKILSRLESRQFDYGDIVINLIPFITEYEMGSLYLNEHRDAKWLNKDDLINLDWAEADVSVLHEFLFLRND